MISHDVHHGGAPEPAAARGRVLVVDDSSTIRKVVAAILARYEHVVVVSPDGASGLERLRREPFDLVLVDWVMPHMSGAEFCDAVRADAALAHTPIVLMSAMDDALGDENLRLTRAIDAIRKPFDARALVAVVEAALRRAAHTEHATEPFDELELTPLPPSELPEDPGLRRKSVAADFARTVSALVAGGVARASEGRVREGDVEAALVRALTPEAVDVLAVRLRDLELDGAHEALSGDLVAVPLPEVLQLLHMQRQSGICTVTNGQVEVAITLREGLIDLAVGRGAADEFRLGRYLVEDGLVTAEELAHLLRNRAGLRRLLGDMLVQYGVLAEEDVRRALVRQTSELVYDVLRWPSGRFSFAVSASRPEADMARLGLQVSALVLEGFRRVDEWRLIEQAIDFDGVLERDERRIAELPAAKLTRQEERVLGVVDGQRTVREILALATIGSFDGCKILYQLLQSRLVHRLPP